MSDSIKCAYEILGIPKDATSSQIKKAYHKNAIKWHPDKNKSEEAKQKFQEISKAYEVLSEPEKRKAYDTFGWQASEGGSADPTDIFNMFMGGMGGMGGFMSGFAQAFGETECLKKPNPIP